MKALSRIVYWLLLLGILAPGSGLRAQESPLDRMDEIDSIVADMTQAGQFSGVVLVADSDTILFSQSYGLADREWDVPNTPDTRFRIGSLTQQFTAMAVVLLEERSLLTFQDPICLYVDPCPAAWKPITLQYLLLHTSGIPDSRAYPDDDQWRRLPVLPLEILKRSLSHPLDFEPGDHWSMSDLGYSLLGLVIEQVSGETYAAFLLDNFFGPLGLDATGVDDQITIIPHLARGYLDAQHPAAYLDLSTQFASGDLYSTAGDLARWTQALHDGKVITPASWDAMLAQAVPNAPNQMAEHYVYGLGVGAHAGQTFFFSRSLTNGYSSAVLYLTRARRTFVALSNVENATAVESIVFDAAGG